ncbi:hypothetical protein Tco_0513073, partial [Tanacetum coccineum]
RSDKESQEVEITNNEEVEITNVVVPMNVNEEEEKITDEVYELKRREKRKQHRATFKTKRSFSISKCLHLLHMDLFGPVKPQTISHNKYTLIILDEYYRYT